MTTAVGAFAALWGTALTLQLIRLPDTVREAAGSSLGVVLVIAGIGAIWLGELSRRQNNRHRSAGLARPVTMGSTDALKGGVR